MKLAEALAQVKDLKGKIRDVQNKVARESYFKKVTDVQDVPSIEGLLEEFQRLVDDLRKLKTRIARTNTSSGLINKIHEMEQLRYLVSSLDSLEDAKLEVVTLERIDYDGPAQPFTTYATFDVEKLSATVSEARTRLRKLDMEVQQLNWTTELEEL